MSTFDEIDFLPDVPRELSNAMLPDPDLLNYYKDISQRILFLEGEIEEPSLEFVKEIYRFNAVDKGKPVEERVPIRIFIDSNGGDVQVMWCLINAIKKHVSRFVLYRFALQAYEL